MKAIFNNYSIEFQVSGSQITVSSCGEQVKAVDINPNGFGFQEFKAKVTKMVGGNSNQITFIK